MQFREDLPAQFLVLKKSLSLPKSYLSIIKQHSGAIVAPVVGVAAVFDIVRISVGETVGIGVGMRVVGCGQPSGSLFWESGSPRAKTPSAANLTHAAKTRPIRGIMEFKLETGCKCSVRLPLVLVWVLKHSAVSHSAVSD